MATRERAEMLSAALWKRRQALEAREHLREGSEEDYRNRRKWLEARLVVLGARLLGLYERGRRNTHDIALEYVTLHPPRLPEALEGLRILHCSDFHYGRFDPKFGRVVHELLAGTEADLAFFTGDYRYGYFGGAEHVYPQVAALVASLRIAHGVYGTLGNHDLSDMVAPLEEAGVTMLVNRGVALSVRDVPVWIGGVDDSHKFHCASPEAALAGAPEEAFKMLLAHGPAEAIDAAGLGVDLYFCGHTHGGQICFPLLGAVRTNARAPRAYAEGVWRCGSMCGYTSRGLGTTDVPLRYRCRPEATLIKLCR